MAAVFEFVNVRPDLRLPGRIMRGRFAAGGAAGVERGGAEFQRRDRPRKFQKDAAHFLDLIVLIEQVFVAKEVAEAQFVRLGFSLGAALKRTILGAQLLG